MFSTKGFYVYEGRSLRDGKLLYIGCTTQIPEDRFRWHKHNGKNYKFKVLENLENVEQMLDKEFELIQKFNPPKNKIKKRRSNFNGKLSEEELKLRIGVAEWCQSCLRRRVNIGFKSCVWCGGLEPRSNKNG